MVIPWTTCCPDAKQDRFMRLVHFEFFPNGLAVNAEMCTAQLERLNNILRVPYPAMINRIGHSSNTRMRLHTDLGWCSKKSQNLMESRFCYICYSPNLGASDKYLFRSMVHFLHGRHFEHLKEVKNGCQEFFA